MGGPVNQGLTALERDLADARASLNTLANLNLHLHAELEKANGYIQDGNSYFLEMKCRLDDNRTEFEKVLKLASDRQQTIDQLMLEALPETELVKVVRHFHNTVDEFQKTLAKANSEAHLQETQKYVYIERFHGLQSQCEKQASELNILRPISTQHDLLQKRFNEKADEAAKFKAQLEQVKRSIAEAQPEIDACANQLVETTKRLTAKNELVEHAETRRELWKLVAVACLALLPIVYIFGAYHFHLDKTMDRVSEYLRSAIK